jgi:small GTP-binding protein
MMIWDVLGQKSGSTMHSAYFSGANGALIVCDGTRPETLDGLISWYHEFTRVAGKVPVIPLVNKCDLESNITPESLETASAEIGQSFRRTSAKTGEGVEEAFMQLGRLLVGG